MTVSENFTLRDAAVFDFENAINERRRAQDAARPGTIYFVGFGDGPIKIGFTANLDYRMEHLQTACPYKLELLATVKGGLGTERELHTRFAEHRIRGEWFSPAPDILAEIARLTQET